MSKNNILYVYQSTRGDENTASNENLYKTNTVLKQQGNRNTYHHKIKIGISIKKTRLSKTRQVMYLFQTRLPLVAGSLKIVPLK